MPRRNARSKAQKNYCQKRIDRNLIDNGQRPSEESNEISVRASYCQADMRFSELSRGSQCVANAFMFLAYLHEAQDIDGERLDHVLIKGDELYRHIRRGLEARRMFVSRHLTLEDVPNMITVNGKHYRIEKSTIQSGYLLQDAPEGLESFLNLSLRLELLGSEYSQGLLLVGNVCISVFCDNRGRYGFFDSHSRNAKGSDSEYNGKAVMVTFHVVSDLTNRLLQLFFGSLLLEESQQYDLLPLRFQELPPDPIVEVGVTEDDQNDLTPDVLKKVLTLKKIGKTRRQKAVKRLQRAQKCKKIDDEEKKRNEMKIRQKKSDVEKTRYRLKKDNIDFRLKQKQQKRDRYWTNSALRFRKQEDIRYRYRHDAAFQQRQKQHITKRYRYDPEYQQRQKQHMRQQMKCRYKNEPDYRLRQNTCVMAKFKKRYTQDATFRSAHLMVHGRHFKLRRSRDLKALHSIRCGDRIKDKYRNLTGFNVTDVSMENLSDLQAQREIEVDPVMRRAQSVFKLNVQRGPTHICTVCHRCLFPNQVRRCDHSVYTKDRELATMCLTGAYIHVCEDRCSSEGECIMPERKQEWICHCCHDNIKSGHLPSIAVANNLELDPIPEELQGLNVLERHVIAKFIPFAKIISLPKGQQRGIHGAVVCVPAEVESTVESLPRPASESRLLRVKLKRRLRYKGHFQFQNLDMRKVRTALLKLKDIHSEYSGVSVREVTEDDYLQTTEHAPAENNNDETEEENIADNIGDKAEEQPAQQDHHEESDIIDVDMTDWDRDWEEAAGFDPYEQPPEREDSDETEANSPDGNEEGEGSGSDSEEEQPDEQDDNVAQQRAIAFDSCLQPVDIGQELLSFGDNIYSIAPAEGNQPVGFFKTPKLESMAFPVQFNTGKNTFDEADRPKKLSPSRYFNARLFSADNRFAMDSNYIFFAQFVTEMHLAMSSMSIQLRKGKVLTKDGRRITSSLLKNQTEVQKLVREGDATRFMQALRGTPAFWKKTMNDLFACLRQLGTPTFFATFSAAEMRWPEIIEVIKMQQGETVTVSDLDWTTKCDILRSNPVTVIRMFEKRVEALMRDLILSPAQPIGEVVDYFYRVEFQARGSPHIHCLFWIKDAPKFGDAPDEVIATFIDKYISCQLPDEELDPELHKIVKEVQTHSRSHTKSCKKGNRHCRYGYPKPPVKTTFITTPAASNPDGPCPQRRAKAKLNSVWDLLHDPSASVRNTDSILAQCKMTYEEYCDYLNSMSYTNVIMMKRDPKDCWTNCYNPHLLRAWDANMDIQYILNPYSCVEYIMSYITKSEHEMSEYLKSVVQDSSHQNATDLEHMKHIMQAYSKNREVSIQEAVTRVCSLRLKCCSREVIWVPTDENRLKLSLPMAELEKRDPNSDNVWVTGLLEKYMARPRTEEFEHLCLADFASEYRIVYGRQRNGKNVVPLLNNMGFVKKRTKGKCAVIRYARFTEKKDPEKYYGTLLKLFLPFRAEHQFKRPPYNSYEEFFKCAGIRQPDTGLVEHAYKVVDRNKQRYEKDSEDIERAIEDFSENAPVEDAWANFAPNAELIRIEAISDRQAMDAAQDEDEQDDVPEFRRNPSVKTAVPLVECPVLSSKELRQMYQSLNQTQAAVFYKIRDWALQLVNGGRFDQFFYFVTGGAGTGKSHLIKCVYNEVTKILRRLPTMQEEPDNSGPTVLLSSFTGTAAYNISGNTLHSLLKLPKNLKPPYQGLGNSLDEIRMSLSRLKVIVIDEVSMVSKELFSYVDQRLQQIKGTKRAFGGISVLCVGDFCQLSPVGKTKGLCVFEENTVDIWKDRFQIITLTEIMRQKEDSAFAEMLNRLRVKRKSDSLLDSDKALLASRTFARKEDCPKDVLHIFATNKEVDSHNNEALFVLSSNIIRVDAEDHTKDKRTGRMVKQAAPVQGRKGELLDSLSLSVGARVVIIRNLDTADGLVNGTFGKISKIISKTLGNGKEYVDSIGLELDNPASGAKRRNQSPGNSDNLVYIERLEERNKGRIRLQFPIKLAYACTAHKVQGMTTSSAVVSLKRIFEAGMSYVALSRTTSLHGLYIIDFDETKIYCNEEVLGSMDNMPKADIDQVMPLLMHRKTATQGGITVIHHNVEGLACHIDDIKKHHEIVLGDILCFTETHLFGSFVPEELQLEGYNMFRRNRQLSYSSFPQMARQKGGGCAIYARTNISAQPLQYVVGVTDLEFLALKIRHPFQAVVAAIYRPPTYKTSDFLANVTNLLDAIEIMDQDQVIICGDFNEDLMMSNSKPIQDFFEKRGYSQLIMGATTEKNTKLDLIFTSQPQKCLTSGVLHSYFSYHRPVYTIFNERV